MLQNVALVAKIGFDTAENEPSKGCTTTPCFEFDRIPRSEPRYGKAVVEACADGDKECDWAKMEKEAVKKAQAIANEEAIATATQRAKDIALGGAGAAAAQARPKVQQN